jgi:phosphonate transport system substrate-binding protein
MTSLPRSRAGSVLRFRRSAVAALLAAGLSMAAYGGAPARTPLRLGVVTFYSPRLMYMKYQPLVDFLAAQSGDEWELDLRESYDDTIVALCSGAIDVAYLSPLAYVRADARCGAIPVVRLMTHGKSTYQGLIMVRNESAIRSLGDLRGRTIALGAPMATSSWLVAWEMLKQAGLRLGVDLTCRNYDQHERAARAVLLGDADACAVRDIVGEKFVNRGLRVLAESDPLPNFPLVVAPSGAPRLKDLLERGLVFLPTTDGEVRKMISAWDEELSGGFAVAKASDYEPVRALALRVLGPKALTMPEAEAGCGGGGP